MIFWKFLLTWSYAANLDDLVASLPFLLSQVEAVRVEIFLSSQGSQNKSQCGEVINGVFILGPCS
jgi:hypothetical protein